jgi:hypothetical protein
MINCINKWYSNWEKNGWKTSKGKDVENKDLIKVLYELKSKYVVIFKHVRSHNDPPQNIESEEYRLWYGNYMADKLATDANREYINNKEEDKKEEKSATGVATPRGVSSPLWADFKKLRLAKKSPITNTAIKGIEREAAKAGISLADALTECCERGWVSFKADWYANSSTPAAMSARNSNKYAGAAKAIFGNNSGVIDA